MAKNWKPFEGELKVGDWYILAGQGPLRLESLDNPPAVLTLRFMRPEHQPGIGFIYYASREQVVRPVDRAYLDQYRADSAARDLPTAGLTAIDMWLVDQVIRAAKSPRT